MPDSRTGSAPSLFQNTRPYFVTERANPFVGFRPFDAADAPLFFGRREQTIALVDRLGRTRLLPVVGSRSSGTSSLVLAGLIPTLHAAAAALGRVAWVTVVTRPGDAPFHNLAQALLETAGVGRDAPARPIPREAVQQFAARLRGEGMAAVREWYAARATTGAGRSVPVLLVVDQFHELFAIQRSPRLPPDDGDIELAMQQHLAAERSARDAECAAYVALLQSLARDPSLPGHVVLTMHTDTLADCERYDGLAESVNAHAYLVPRLSPAQLREAIEQPVLRLGGSVAPALVQHLLAYAAARSTDPDREALPLLQHLLLRLWERWWMKHPAADRAPLLDEALLEEIGGVANALALDVERVVGGYDRDMVSRVFKRLTQFAANGRRAPRAARWLELRAVVAARTPEAQARLVALLDALTHPDTHLLRRVDDGQPDNPRYLLATDCLTKHWLALRTWMDEERALGEWYYALADRASRHARGADVELLTRPAWQLAQQRLSGPASEAWVTGRYDDSAAPRRLIHHFVQSSRDARTRRNVTRVAVAALLVAALVAVQIKVGLSDRTVRTQQLESVLSTGLQRFALADPTYGQLLAGFLGVELSEDSLRAFVHRLEERPAALLEVPQVSAVAILDSAHVVTAFLSGDVTVASLQAPQRAVGVVPRAANAPAVEFVQIARNGALLLIDTTGTLEAYTLRAPSGTAVRTTRQPLRSRVLHVARSADSSTIGMHTSDGRLLLWHADTPTRVDVLVDASPVTAFAFSPRDGDRLAYATGGENASVEVVTSLTGAPQASSQASPQFTRVAGVSPRVVQQLALAADGRIVAIAGDDLLELRSPAGSRVVTGFHGTTLAAVNDSAATVVAGTMDGYVALLRAGQASPPTRITEHADYVSAIEVDDDGFALSTSADQAMRYTALADPGEQYALDGHRGVVRAGRTASGFGLLATIDDDNRLRVWQPAPWRSRYLLNATRSSSPSWFISRFGDRLVTTQRDSLMVEQSERAPSGRVRAVAPLPTPTARVLALSPLGTTAILGGEDGRRWWWHERAGAETAPVTAADSLTTLRPFFGALGVDFSSDGALLMAVHADSTVSVLDGNSGTLRTASAWATVRVPTAPRLDSVGAQVAYVDSAGVQVRAVATARLVRRFPRRVNANTVSHALFPSGKRVWWVDDDGRVFVRELAAARDTLPTRAAFTGAPRTTVTSFATRRDEYVFAYVTDRGGLFLLEVLPTSLRQVALPMRLASKDAVRHVAFDSSGLRLVATTEFGSVHLWELWWDTTSEMMRARPVLQREHAPRVRRSSVVQLAASVFSEDGTRLHSFMALPDELSRQRTWDLDANLIRARADRWKTRCVDFFALFREASREFDRDTGSCVFNPSPAKRTPPPPPPRTAAR